MDKKEMNDVVRRNVALLSKQTEKEVGMMPATEAPLPSVQMVKVFVVLVKKVGKEIKSFCANVKQNFTSLGNVFFTLYGKQFFTSYGKEIFIL